jgi:hypothetical protein
MNRTQPLKWKQLDVTMAYRGTETASEWGLDARTDAEAHSGGQGASHHFATIAGASMRHGLNVPCKGRGVKVACRDTFGLFFLLESSFFLTQVHRASSLAWSLDVALMSIGMCVY